jgi:hypothetical protein
MDNQQVALVIPRQIIEIPGICNPGEGVLWGSEDKALGFYGMLMSDWRLEGNVVNFVRTALSQNFYPFRIRA